MLLQVKTFTSPFSFFCVVEDENNNKEMFFKIEDDAGPTRIDFSDVNHGQYLAVLRDNKWTRGIISMESQFLIWLVDQGIFIRPTDSTVYVNLPAEYKKLPSKVFEASIHGVTPVGMVLDEFFQFKNEPTLTWSLAAIEQAQQLIAGSSKTYFVPLSILTTKDNDVVLGDLYLESKDKRLTNLIDEMNSSPVFMERNKELYIKNLPKFYTNRRHHRACLLKPVCTEHLATMTTDTKLCEYNALCEKVALLHTQEADTESEGGSSVTYVENIMNAPNRKSLKLTPQEIEKYSKEYIMVSGREYNVLTVVINKARDLFMCERYKNAKSVGRATTRIRERDNNYD